MLCSNCIYFIYYSKHIRKGEISGFHYGVVEAFTLLRWCICTRNWWHYSTGVKMCNDLEGKVSVLPDYMVCHWVTHSQPSAETAFLQNISTLLPTDTALWLRRTKSSTTALWKSQNLCQLEVVKLFSFFVSCGNVCCRLISNIII